MNAVVGVDADQVRIERRMMDLGKGQPVRDDRLAEVFAAIDNDISGVNQARLK